MVRVMRFKAIFDCLIDGTVVAPPLMLNQMTEGSGPGELAC